MTYLNALAALDDLKLEDDEATGVTILRRALEEPLRRIAVNAGQEGSVVVEEVRRQQRQAGGASNVGYDAAEEVYTDLIERGVIDPAKVTRAALENAASVAAMVLTTESLVTDLPEQEAPAAADPHGHHH